MTKRVEMSAEELAEMETRAEKWKRRALRFQEAYRESEAENTALKIQKMHLEADGVDKVTRIQRDNMKARAMAEINVRRSVEAQLREKERELAAARSAAFRDAAEICEDEGAREACAVAEVLRVKAAALGPTEATFECEAQKANQGSPDYPQDCNWPFCGCDPKADKVLEAIQESGYRLVREFARKCERCGIEIGPLCQHIIWYDETGAEHKRHAIDCTAEVRNETSHEAELERIAEGADHLTEPCNQISEDGLCFAGCGMRRDDPSHSILNCKGSGSAPKGEEKP